MGERIVQFWDPEVNNLRVLRGNLKRGDIEHVTLIGMTPEEAARIEAQLSASEKRRVSLSAEHPNA